MSALRGLALATLVAAAPGVASGYVRSTDRDTKACLYWAPRSVTYRINPSRPATSPSCGPAGASNAGAAAAIEAGFSAWSSEACTDLALERGPDTTELRVGYDQAGGNENLIVFRKGWCSNDDAAKADPCFTDPGVRCSDTYGCFENTGRLAGTSIIALTTTTYSPSTGEIVDADMEFVDWTGEGEGTSLNASTPTTRPHGWYFTCFLPSGGAACVSYGEAGCFSMDLQNTATHEAGHFIGFAHAPEAESTMYASASVGEVAKRSLAPDDVTGICTVYPRAAQTQVCTTVKRSSGGCATGGGAGALALLALFLARRRAGAR